MQTSHDIVKIVYVNGSSETATLINKSKTELTLVKNNIMKTVELKNIKKVNTLSRIFQQSRRAATKPRHRIATSSNYEKDLTRSIQNSVQHSNAKLRVPREKMLYLMSLGNKFYKIGYSGNIPNRLKSFKTSSPHQIKVLSTKRCRSDKIARKEQELIRIFKTKFDQSKGGSEVFAIFSESRALKAFSSLKA